MTYKDLFMECKWSKAEIIRTWETMPIRDLPLRLIRSRQRKGESTKDWRIRGLMILEINEIKRPSSWKSPYAHEQRKTYTVEKLESAGLSREEIALQGFIGPEAINSYNSETNAERRLRQDVYSVGNFQKLRISMGNWTSNLYKEHIHEARCDLDCFNCPVASLLLCSAHNSAVAFEDGYPLEGL